MKKFISMVMAAAMVVSLVPATAFAANEVSGVANVQKTWTRNHDFDGVVDGASVPEVQIKIKDVNYETTTGSAPTAKVTVALENAEFVSLADVNRNIRVTQDATVTPGVTTYEAMTQAEVKELYADWKLGVATGTDFIADLKATAPGVDPVTGTKYSVRYNELTNSIADPSTASATAEANRLAAFTAYATDATNGLGMGSVTGYTFTANSPLYGTAGYAHPSSQFVPLADILAYVADHGTTAMKATVSGGKFVATGLTRDEWIAALGTIGVSGLGAADFYATGTGATVGNVDAAITAQVLAVNYDAEEITITITGWLDDDNVITLDLDSVLKNADKNALVSVYSDDLGITLEDVVYVAVADKALKASVRKVAEVAEEEVATINERGLKVESVVGNLLVDAADDEDLTIKLNKGFAFTGRNENVVTATDGDGNPVTLTDVTVEDDDELVIDIADNADIDTIILHNIEIEAETAKEGDVAVLTVYADDYAKASVEVMKVIEYKVVMTVDEDQDVPVIYSGVNVENDGINDDSDHMSLDVTLKETFAGAWDMDKKFTLSLPEGVYVTGIDTTANAGIVTAPTTVAEVFEDAYIEGDHVDFEFAKRVFNETNPGETANEIEFALQLIADPGFVGDVTLTVEGPAIEKQEVVIAKFVSPMAIKAEQNDVIIDYRFTAIDTPIVVTEAEAGLWEEGLTIGFFVDREDMIQFEDDATFTVNAESDMEIDDEWTITVDGERTQLAFCVEEESEEEAAVVTIDGIELFMQRNIPAGPYDLTLAYLPAGGGADSYDAVELLGQFGDNACTHEECDTVADVCDYSDVVKEAWVNVVTAGRDKDDASFTTKVVVPVGESYLVAGDKQYTLDVPAYINANGYTMLPVRAVAVALGIDNDAVQWDNDTKTVIIMYGQRVITMTAGQKVIYASGTAIPAKSAVEIVDGRAFLGLRDLATALGVTTVNYDAATKTASLN